MCIIDETRAGRKGVFLTPCIPIFRDSLSRFPARPQKTLGGKLRPSWWACVGRREGRNVLRPWRGGAGRLRVLRPVNTEYVIVFQGWRATSGRVRRAISLRNAPTENPVHPPNHGGNVTGTCGRGRRPGGPPPARDVRQPRAEGGVGTAATSAALPHDAARFHFGTHVFPHPATRRPHRRKMRFHRVIILKAIAPRGGFDTCGLPRGCLGGPGSARSGCVPGSCPSRACRDLHYIPVRSAGGRRHGHPPRKSGKEGERTVSLSTGKEAPQDALLSTESIEVRHLVPKGFLSIRQTGIYWLAMKNIVSAFICFLLLLCMDSPQQLHCRECLSSQHCLLRLRHYFRS